MIDYDIDCEEALRDFKEYVQEENIKLITTKFANNKGYYSLTDGNRYIVPKEYGIAVADLFKVSGEYENDLIFGKNKDEQIVAVEYKGNQIEIFKNNGLSYLEDFEPWILSPTPLGADSTKLEGNLHYKYKRSFSSLETFRKARAILYKKRADFYQMFDPVEAFMASEGVTLFKGLKVEDVSALSFDIETTGLTHNDDSKVLMISNTFRDNKGKITRKLFSLDEYDGHDSLMIEKWSDWVREMNPSVMLGHNIFGFDLPYLSYCYIKRNPHHKRDIDLGRDGSAIVYGKKPSKFRKDGSQEYDYFNATIFGRQIIDTFFLSIKYDFGRKYDSYGLKPIIEAEGLEKKDRIKWDWEKNPAKDIYNKMKHPLTTEEMLQAQNTWKDFKVYCEDDSDDALKLYDLMIPAFFYYTQSLPMSLQKMNNSATGRQINAFLIRAYLQNGNSIPRTSESVPYGGGLSFGNPGIYNNVYKVDVASLYPSIMITEEIYDRKKDPKGLFLEMVQYFTNERLQNKQKGKETGDRYYKDMEQAQKIFINSAYGLLGTPGLNFNSFHNADKVTATGRAILQTGIDWVAEKEFTVVNVDTDSFSYSPPKKLLAGEFDAHIADINTRFKDGIIWEDDGYFQKFIVVKAKNYVLYDGKTVKIKGSGLKATNKERALQKFLRDVIMLLLKNKKDHIFDLYQEYANQIKDLDDMTDWAMKKTVTKAVLNPGRTQEQKVLDAIQSIHYQEGDKVRLFSKDKDTLCLVDQFEGEYHKETYFQKLHDTLSIFGTLVDPTLFPNYKLTRNKNLL